MRRRIYLILFLVIFSAVAAGIFDYQPFWRDIHAKTGLPLSLVRPWRLGLDLVGGSILIYEIDLSQSQPGDYGSIANGLRDVIERRVNLFGVSEPQVFVAQSGSGYRLIVELAGIKDIEEAIRQIGRTALLDFRKVARVEPENEEEIDGDTDASAEAEAKAEAKAGIQYVFIPTALNGRYLKRAAPVSDPNTGLPEVSVEFNSEGAAIFEDLTRESVGELLSIFLDDEEISRARVNEVIVGGRAVITGRFSVEETQQLASLLNAGALPAPINLVSQQTIGASLGEDSLQKAILAGIIGTILVMFFMIVYYRTFGIFAALALLIYAVLTLAVFKLIPVTLTLAGIAGLILSVGMAVDANILIFERIKEELRRGLTRTAAVEAGFRRAWSSIRDSNITTIITAVILYYFTSSFVKGFALALLVGVLVSMFSAINVTRTFLRAFIKD